MGTAVKCKRTITKDDYDDIITHAYYVIGCYDFGSVKMFRIVHIDIPIESEYGIVLGGTIDNLLKNSEVYDVTEAQLKIIIRQCYESGDKVINAGVVNDKVVTLNGELKRYMLSVRKTITVLAGLRNKKSRIIKGYIVADDQGSIKVLSKQQLISMLSKYFLTNAKVVNRNNRQYISAISGNIPVVDFLLTDDLREELLKLSKASRRISCDDSMISIKDINSIRNTAFCINSGILQYKLRTKPSNIRQLFEEAVTSCPNHSYVVAFNNEGKLAFCMGISEELKNIVREDKLQEWQVDKWKQSGVHPERTTYLKASYYYDDTSDYDYVNKLMLSYLDKDAVLYTFKGYLESDFQFEYLG